MNPYKVSVFVVSVLGASFSGYLAITKLLTSSCALSEPCPYFLGYPACYFGFALFLTLAVLSGVLLFGSLPARRASLVLTIVSGLGIIFAGRFTIPEVVSFLHGTTYTMVLPTCAYGLVFFAAAFVLSLKLLQRANIEEY